MSPELIVDWFLDRGVEFNVIRVDGETRYYFGDGFYKSDGCAYLVGNDIDGTKLHARYDEVTIICRPEDVIAASKGWHEFSCDRFSGWKYPPAAWQELYSQLNKHEDDA